MARKIHSRLKIKGTLVAETPLHIGGYGDSPDTDLPLAQNGKGEWYVPGTSIAGVLRNWILNNFNERIVKDIFGFQKDDEGHASFVLIEDATIDNAKEVLAEIRDGVGIDRFYGVAADKAKFDRAILPRGTRLNFAMTIEIGAKKESNPKVKDDEERKGENDTEFEKFENRVKRTKAVIGHLLDALQHEKVRFGASKTRGLGRLKLEGKKKEDGEFENEPEIKEQGLVGFDNILKLLNDSGDTRSIKDLKDAASLFTSSSPRLDITITWKPRLPVMVKAGYDGIGVDMLPLTSGTDKDNLALVLPGSSIKGAIRSHAERIVRTLLDCDCAKGKDLHEQIDSIPLVEELFGGRSKSESERKNSDANKKCKSNQNMKLGLGALAIDDCYTKAEYSMNAKQWRGVEIAGVDNEKSHTAWELWQKLDEIPNVKFQPTHHVAIDRWTGGASEGALYSVLAPTKIDWEPIRLTLDFERIENDSRLLVLMLLLLILRDVAENRLPFGFATNRGMGEIEVKSFEFIGSGKLKVKKVSEKDGNIVEENEDIEVDLIDALSATVEKDKCKFADGVLKEQTQMRWKKWLK